VHLTCNCFEGLSKYLCILILWLILVVVRHFMTCSKYGKLLSLAVNKNNRSTCLRQGHSNGL